MLISSLQLAITWRVFVKRLESESGIDGFKNIGIIANPEKF